MSDSGRPEQREPGGGAEASRVRPASAGGAGTHSGRRLAAVIFTDVVGYSARMQRDETGTLARVAADFTLMRERCEQHGGEVLNSMGDGLLLSFASAVQAVAWALQVQSEFVRRRASRPPAEALEHRMGIHIGDVFRQEAGGLAGDGVNIAARLEGRAPAGGVCISQMVYDTVKGKVPMQAVFIGPESFKNIAEPIPIWHIAAEDSLAPARPTLQGRTPRIPDYELLRRIGQGGYGEVWLARGLTGILRAVKIVWRDRFADAEPFEREFHGVKESMAISHEAGQLALHHVGQDERAGFFYYVMELADDATKGRAIEPAQYVPLTLKELKAQRGRLPAAEGVAIGAEVARSLAALHARGLVHRDIKPSNIVLVNGAPKLADIGLVSASADARTMVGTQGYLPPEGPGAPAADVYALGKVLYELATGLDRDEFPRLPERSGDAAEQRAFFGLNEIILRACEPHAGQRYRDAGAMRADLEALHQGRAPRRVRGRRATLALAAVLVLVAGGAAWFRGHPGKSATAAPPAAAAARLIAVLPLENLSPDPNDAFFADGVHEELLTDLANLKDLRVISRTSVMPYRGTKKKIGEIARELGVSYVVEGSVRRAGNRVRVTGQLINAATDEPVWARSYDRELQDIFAVQSELAREIAGALDGALSPAETAGLAAAPTRNLEAYECLQRARVLDRSNVNEHDMREKILPLLERAVALDPDYAEAWAELCEHHLMFYGNDHTASRLAEAKAALDRAERLAPDSYAVLTAGSDFGAVAGDRAMVNARRQRIIALFPNRAESHLMRALDASYAARWPDARAEYLAALQLDPRNPDVLESYFFMLDSLRRWDEAEPVGATLVAVQPDNLEARLVAASMAFRRSGSTAALTRLLAELPRTDEGGKSAIAARSRIAFLTGDWAGIVGLWRETGAGFRTGGFEDQTARFMVAGAFLKLGNAASARPLLEKNREELTRQVQTAPRDAGRWNQLGLALGMIGDRSGARAALDRAAELIAADREGYNSSFGERWDNVLARCWCDEKAAVIAKLGVLLREPVEHPPTATVRVLRIHWASIPLQGDPDFEAMLNDPRNNAPLF